MAISGKLTQDAVIFEKHAIEELHGTGFYGQPKGDKLEVSLPESAYLIYQEKIKVELEGKELDFKQFFLKASSIVKNFELLYIVYKDLRERGYYVQPSVTGFRVYPRGGYPGKTPAEFFVFVTSERIPLQVFELKKLLSTTENLKKSLILAIVDEESDITYYGVKRTIPSGSYELKLNKSLSIAGLLEDRCMVRDLDASLLLHNEGFFGRLMDKGLQLSLVESCYLLKKGILEIEQKNNKKLDFAEFSGIASKIESDFITKFAVYEMLRNNRLVPKTGFKFGTHFRVYKSSESISKHSDYLVHAIDNNHVFSLQQLSRAVRLANSVRKEMLYGIVDTQVEFIAVERVRL